MKKLFLACWLAAMPLAPAFAFSVDWKPVGAGDMRWTFFKLYRIQLLTDTGLHRQGVTPQSLEITYYRDIPSSTLVEATGDQWDHLKLSNNASANWLVQLDELWPDVKQGDTLRFEVDAENNNRFLHNGSLIGGIDDTDFSVAFLSIWLSPNTSEPKLRQQLITARQ